MAVQNPDFPDDPNDPTPGGGGSGTPTSYGTAVFNLSFFKLDASSSLEILCYLNCYNQDDLQFSAYAFLDNNLVQVGTVNAVFDTTNSKGQQTMVIITIVDGIAAGAHTVIIRVKNRETEGPLVVQAGSILKVTEMRQGGK